MKSTKTIVFIIALSFSFVMRAQDSEISNKTSIDKNSYYQNRAEEDAKYEQQFSAKTSAEEKAFWKDQKNYEMDLKHNDKKAYKAYMKGKKDAYASHYDHCDNHCHHSNNYYHHASFYYYRYDGNYNERYSQNNSMTTRVQVRAPSVRLGLF